MKLPKEKVAAMGVAMIILTVGAFLLFQRQAFRQSLTNGSQKENQSFTPIVDTPPIVKETSVNSPDGMMKLTMRSSQQLSRIDYTFLVTNRSADHERRLYSKSADAAQPISLSGNAWSPDNKYVFIVEPDPMMILVFKASGEPFGNGEKYLNAVELFQKSKPGFVITEVTGWMSPTIMQLATTTDKQEKGPYYWFVVPTSSFLVRS